MMSCSNGTIVDDTAGRITAWKMVDLSTEPCLLDIKSPWGKNSPCSTPAASTPCVSFAEVMSEQLADSLVEQEFGMSDLSMHDTSVVEANVDPDTSSDETLALMLQAQLDKEHNECISKEEKRVNQHSKVKLSLNNYRTDENFLLESSDNETSDGMQENEEKVFIDISSQMLQIGKSKGYKVFGNSIVTKHDGELCGRRNVARMEDTFPAEFFSGDARGMDLQLPNRIYNSLKRHAYSEQRRGQRLHETKEHYTTEHAVDEKTRLILHSLVNRGVLARINGVVSVGKESVVIHADGGDAVPLDESIITGINLPENRIIPDECAIKVFKTTLSEFRRRDKYIRDDYRFKDRFKKLNPRKIIHMWAEKEMHNLMRMQDAGVPCPDVVLLKKHVLVMSFIGTDQCPAPKLKNASLSHAQRNLAYSQVVEIMKTLYDTCRLIHSDLSEYNLLWNDEKVWVIDVSQAVEPNHPHGLEFLFRDCQNVSRFFKNCQAEDVSEPMQLFNEVSGLDFCVNDAPTFISELERLQRTSEEHSHQNSSKSTSLFEA